MSTSPPHPLDGCRLKLRRVHSQLKQLTRRVERFKLNSYRIIREQDDVTQLVTFAVADMKAVPETFTILVGETAYNLRSCLDQLMRQVILVNDPTFPEDAWSADFPIFTDPIKFEKHARKDLVNLLSRDQILEIKKLQPCVATKPLEHPLWVLQGLNNIDKHRFALKCEIGTGTAINWDMSRIPTDAPSHAVSCSGILYPFGPQNGDEIGSARIPDNWPYPEYQIDMRVTSAIKFGSGSGPAVNLNTLNTFGYIFDYLCETVFVKPGLLDSFSQCKPFKMAYIYKPPVGILFRHTQS